MGMGGSASDPSLYDWGIEKLFGNQHVSRFSRMEPVIQIGDVYGGEPFEKIKIGDTEIEAEPGIGFVQFVQPFQVIRVFHRGRPHHEDRSFHLRFGKNGLGVLGAFLHRDSDIAVGSRHVYGAETENQIGHGGVIDTGAVFGNPAFSDLKARMFADAQIVEGGRRDGKAGALGRQSGESSDPASGKGIVDPQSDGVAKKEKCFHSPLLVSANQSA